MKLLWNDCDSTQAACWSPPVRSGLREFNCLRDASDGLSTVESVGLVMPIVMLQVLPKAPCLVQIEINYVLLPHNVTLMTYMSQR